MSRTIRITNVPDRVYRTIKACAEQAGVSISEYLLSELEVIGKVETRPKLEEMRKRLNQREPILVPIDTAQLVRDERDRI